MKTHPKPQPRSTFANQTVGKRVVVSFRKVAVYDAPARERVELAARDPDLKRRRPYPILASDK